MIISPGTYLRKRREAAALSIGAAARNLVMLPSVRRMATQHDVIRLQGQLAGFEADLAYMAPEAARILVQAFTFDPWIYEQLFSLHHAGAEAGGQFGLPVPRICRVCACSWHDACLTSLGQPCAWSDHDPELCTACAAKPVPAPVPMLTIVEGACA